MTRPCWDELEQTVRIANARPGAGRALPCKIRNSAPLDYGSGAAPSATARRRFQLPRPGRAACGGPHWLLVIFGFLGRTGEQLPTRSQRDRSGIALGAAVTRLASAGRNNVADRQGVA